MIKRIHATGRARKQGGDYWLCNRKRWGYTSSTYANCKRCARILVRRGYKRTEFGWVYARSTQCPAS